MCPLLVANISVDSGNNRLQHIKTGDLICIENGGYYYYFLILSGPAFFGCQWTYSFHFISKEITNSIEALAGNGFLALVDFIEERRSNSIVKIKKNIDTKPYFNETKLKARIDTYNGGHQWYIYSMNFEILKKQKKLLPGQEEYPIASGLKCKAAMQLIDKKWVVSQVVYEEGRGQFPL